MFKENLSKKNYVEAFICMAKMVKVGHRYIDKADRLWIKRVYGEPDCRDIITKSEDELWKRYSEKFIYNLYDKFDKIPPLGKNK